MFVLVELVNYDNNTTQMPYDDAMFCILGSVEVNIAIVSGKPRHQIYTRW